MSDIIEKENYEEPRCLLNMHPEIVAIPTRRILEKLDAYLDRKDFFQAERLLHYWRAEADTGHDMRGKLTILNEMIGFYRKTGKEAECLAAIADALSLMETSGMKGTVTGATTLVNAATGYKAFGKAADAIPLYREARSIYEAELKSTDDRLGGLYNNMALALADLGSYREAEELYRCALHVMEQQEHGEPDMAITYLNLADLVTAELGPEDGEAKISAYLQTAEDLLNRDDVPRGSYYAFVCEKCAPIFGYYGYFMTEKELSERARAFYERD